MVKSKKRGKTQGIKDGDGRVERAGKAENLTGTEFWADIQETGMKLKVPHGGWILLHCTQ